MKNKIVAILFFLIPFIVLGQNNNNNLTAYTKTVIKPYTTGDLVMPLGSGGNRGYIINVYIGGGWAELTASFEIHKTWGLNNFYVSKATYAYPDMRRRLRIWCKNMYEARANITLTWINESPDKSWENFIRADIIPIGNINALDADHTWETNDITAFTGFTDISDNGLASYGGSALSEMYGNFSINNADYNGLNVNKSSSTDDNVHIRLNNNSAQTNISNEHRSDIWLADDGVLRLRNVTDKGIAIRNAGGTVDMVKFQSNGNVGIGTTSPASLLTIRNGNTGVSIHPGGNPYFGTLAFNRESATGQIFDPAGNAFQINNGGGDGNLHFQVYNGNGIPITGDAIVVSGTNGNVGIGIANPGPYKLAVEGIIGARKIKVTQANPWADYVFDSAYQLQPLTQVEQFIKTNKHLPDVPSAKEVAKDGIDVGDNQTLLLKKIEELTLYMIEMRKEIEILKLKINKSNTHK